MLKEDKYFDAGEVVDEVLKTEPQFFLPDNFADVLAEKVGRRFAWEQYFKEFLIYLSVIIGIAATWVAIAFIWQDADWKVWLDFIISNAGLVAGINILLVFILFADRVLLRYFMFKSKLEVL